MNIKNRFQAIFNFVLIICIVSTVFVARASDSNIKSSLQVKDGLAIYLGLLPAEMIDGHVAHSMHGGLPIGENRYHIAIAIFDDKTGKRIKNAKVQVSVNRKIGIGTESNKLLEDMKLNGKFMYGNYFSLKTAGPYRIDVNIKFVDGRKSVNVLFKYDFAHT